jgi:hypothetical protein
VEYTWNPDEELEMCKRIQGMRSDFLYEGDNPATEGIHMIWPEFLDNEGKVILQRSAEVGKNGYANMWIIQYVGVRVYVPQTYEIR